MTDRAKPTRPPRQRPPELKVVLHPSLFQGDRLTAVLAILERMLAEDPPDRRSGNGREAVGTDET